MQALLVQYWYLMIFPICFFEGQVSTLVIGFLVGTGFFNLWIVFLLIWAADIACDNMYYRLGRRAHKSERIRNFIDKSDFLSKNMKLMEKVRKEHPMKTMVLWKNAYIISVAIIASAGVTKMPYHRFLMYSIPAALVQPIVLLFIGYNLGSSYNVAIKYLPYPGIIILVILIIMFFFYRKLNQRIAKNFVK